MPPPKREPSRCSPVPRTRCAPQWVAPFLAALASCGNVTRAAALAGVDVTGPYNRRARYPEFRDAWEQVMAERALRASSGPAVRASLDTLGSLDVLGSLDTLGSLDVLGTNGEGEAPSSRSPLASPSSPSRGEELALSRAGFRRVAASRWSRQKEERFLEELTASANVARAAAAAGFSAAAIYRRKLRDSHFAQGWEAAITVGRSRLEAHLIAAAERSFDPEGLPVAEGAPKVTVGEALGILKHRPAAAKGSDDFPTWQEEGDAMSNAEVTALRERILDKLERVRAIDDREKNEAGWTQDGDGWVPPGWVRASPSP